MKSNILPTKIYVERRALESTPDPGLNGAKGYRFVTLDLLRGVAALAVASGHFTGIPAHSYLAVDFFLVLSGFILAHRYLYGKSVDFYHFVLARLARLYPLHLLTLIVFAAISLLRFRRFPEYIDGTIATFVANVFLLQNVGLTPSELTWNAPSWSISVEFWINMMFFALISQRTSTAFLVIASTAALAIIAFHERTLAVSLHNYFGFLNSGLLRGFASFVIGVLAYRHFVDRRESKLKGRTREALKCIVLTATVAIMACARPGLEFLDFIAPFLFFICIVLFAADSERWLHVISPISHLGTISYSIYLIHYPILYGIRYLKELYVGTGAKGLAVDVVFDPLGSFALYVILVLGLSHLTYIWFEQPSRALSRGSMRYSAKQSTTNG